MNSGENIYKAFEVVNKTHENISKLIDYCKDITAEREEYVLMSPRFLRYKSDSDYWGWNIRQLFLLFQDTEDKLLKNGWRNGPVYVLEIVLYDPDLSNYFGSNEPRVELAKFEYENIRKFSSGVSPASYDCFAHPLYDLGYEEIKDGIFFADVPKEISKKYWGVKRIVCKDIPLIDINSDNAYEKIFGTFKLLKKI